MDDFLRSFGRFLFGFLEIQLHSKTIGEAGHRVYVGGATVSIDACVGGLIVVQTDLLNLGSLEDGAMIRGRNEIRQFLLGDFLFLSH